MKIAKLIKKLQEIEKEHPDLVVHLFNELDVTDHEKPIPIGRPCNFVDVSIGTYHCLEDMRKVLDIVRLSDKEIVEHDYSEDVAEASGG